jgi:hypothetical protein
MRAAAQTHCFAEIALDRTSVYVQQPFKVTITVLTATWYTAPLDFDNIQIPNAFTLPFDQTTPGMFTVRGNQYAGLQFYFIVFPYTAGTFKIPPIHIVATTPPKGSYTAVKVKLSTPPRSFTVKPVPDKLKGSNWLVAKNVFIKEHWNKSLQHLKVGDVIERTISIDAKGTLPQFIPPLHNASLHFASEYLQDPELDDERTDYDANGRLTQSMVYLLEKEGDFEIPPVEITWWNPLNSKLYKRAAPGVKIKVQPNPQLGMMTTLKDSLAATQTSLKATIPSKGPLHIAGIPWYWFTLYLLAAGLLLYLITRWSIRLYRSISTWRIAYRQSEQYLFRQLRFFSSTAATFVRNLYRWWDSSHQPDKRSSITSTWRAHRETVLRDEWNTITQALYGPQQQGVGDMTLFKKNLSQYHKKKNRNSFPYTEKLVSENQLPWGYYKQTKTVSS